jgi:hypothetical protein
LLRFALQAAQGFLFCSGALETQVDLDEIMGALFRILFRHFLPVDLHAFFGRQ